MQITNIQKTTKHTTKTSQPTSNQHDTRPTAHKIQINRNAPESCRLIKSLKEVPQIEPELKYTNETNLPNSIFVNRMQSGFKTPLFILYSRNNQNLKMWKFSHIRSSSGPTSH